MMDIVKALRLIEKGFEHEKVTDSQAKSAVATIQEAADEIERLRGEAAPNDGCPKCGRPMHKLHDCNLNPTAEVKQ